MQLPSVDEQDVKLRFLGSPINPADLNQIQGTYPSRPVFVEGIGAIAGNEGVAEVVEVGNRVTQQRDLKVGDWVIPANASFGNNQFWVQNMTFKLKLRLQGLGGRMQ
jgi:trans-2-enoyl-CoA reductase